MVISSKQTTADHVHEEAFVGSNEVDNYFIFFFFFSKTWPARGFNYFFFPPGCGDVGKTAKATT